MKLEQCTCEEMINYIINSVWTEIRLTTEGSDSRCDVILHDKQAQRDLYFNHHQETYTLEREIADDDPDYKEEYDEVIPYDSYQDLFGLYTHQIYYKPKNEDEGDRLKEALREAIIKLQLQLGLLSVKSC